MTRRGHTHGGNIHTEGTYTRRGHAHGERRGHTHGGDTHTEKTCTRRGHAHGGDMHTEGTCTRRRYVARVPWSPPIHGSSFHIIGSPHSWIFHPIRGLSTSNRIDEYVQRFMDRDYPRVACNTYTRSDIHM